MQERRDILDVEDRFRDMTEEGTGPGKEALAKVEAIPVTLYLAGVFASIALSALFFLTGKRSWALFVGLWPPTIMNIALAMKELRPSHELPDRAAAG